jgi:aspartyl-tRNA(Asn)/glutamyl-tRNA(Gln) amidotransferase subunit C
MALDTAAVARIASLARIRPSEAELDPLADELSHILTWVEQLNEVDTTGVAPMASAAAASLPMRADAVTDGGCPSAILGNAPRAARGFFTVPKVVE